MNADKKARLIEAFGRGLTWREACKEVDIAMSTLWRWTQLDPEFHRAMKDACAGPDHEVEAVTYQNAIDPDPAHNVLRMFWLKSRMPNKYKDRQEVSVDRAVPVVILPDNGRQTVD